MKKQLQTRRLVLMALLIALSIVCSRYLAIELPTMKFSTTFIPNSLMGALFGPSWGVAGGILSDLLGIWMNPKSMPYYGFTLSAALIGWIYGICLHRETIRWKHVIIASALTNLGVQLFLNTLWIQQLSHVPYWPTFIARVPIEIITMIIQAIVLKLLLNLLPLKKWRQ